MKRLMMTASLALFSLENANAFPEWDRKVPPQPELAFNAESYDFRGIVALSGCSGSLVKFDDSALSDRAMVLTNGHCVRMLAPGLVIVKEAAWRSFDLLSAAGKKLGKVQAKQLLYATMTKTDLGLYQLVETYQEIQDKYDIEPLVFARQQSEVGTSVEVISGYWKRGFSCAVEAIAFNLQEGKWLFESSMRYTRPGCDVFGGTSGSPVLEAGTRNVVAVNNSANESGRRCEVNNPCEIDEAGNVSYQKGYGYAQQTYWVYSCRNANGEFNEKALGCELPQPQ